jgi:endonuclease-3
LTLYCTRYLVQIPTFAPMNKSERAGHIIAWFEENFKIAETELNYHNPYQLLVAVILSAQCTDKRVNIVTPPLFRQFPTPQQLAEAEVPEVFEYIKSISYPNNKAKHLVGMAQKLVNDFQGEVPETMEQLISLPGVGRKTANVILSVIYNQPTMAVDTHVFRVSKRLGIVTQTAKTPLAVEQQLYKYFAKEIIPKAHHWLILHGRYVCLARSPKCGECGLKDWCRYYELQGT